ncbi:GNAT family N-acetyltransferase [Nonomuraea sp. NPDC046570]|uniref:GNAT family N-acetyltransferase n=1 Tax=Nonomuraea sp. NPDC046570 TaxID=3155255 RepID=UPI0033EEF911
MDIRDLTLDDFDAVLDSRQRAFGLLSAADVERWRAMAESTFADGRYLGAFDGARLVATARLRSFTQWWHGRPQPMAGIASVTVTPEDRGRGAGRLIMRAAMGRAAELGDAVSALYPATTRIYRSLGWEHAGAQHLVRLPAEALRTIRPTEPVKLRRMGPDDAPDLVALLGRLHGAARSSGPVSWDENAWRTWLANPGDFLYLADDGFAVYRWKGDDIEVAGLMAGSEATARALWSMVGTSATMAKTVVAAVAPDDPVLWLVGDRDHEHVEQVRWMFRTIDLAEAVARRGFPAALTLDAVVEVDDPERPANSGPWRLEIAGGSGAATAAASTAGAPRLSVNGFSALYAGVPTATLRRGGLMTGPGGFDEALDSAFAAKPYMLDYF